tara:strand:- start:72 stop:470 length:399 start_codon:yes stop_codon:yes gene_type:complete
MNKVIYVIFGLLISVQANSSALICTPSEEFSKHFEKVRVSYEWDKDAWLVIAHAPTTIDGLPFGLIQINKGTNGNVLSAHLRTEVKGTEIEAHFYASETTLGGMSLSVSYGERCMETVVVPLKHNKSKHADL